MNRECIKAAIDALEEAYEDILLMIPPGTPGKIEAATKLRFQANQIFFQYATHNINNRRTAI